MLTALGIAIACAIGLLLLWYSERLQRIRAEEQRDNPGLQMPPRWPDGRFMSRRGKKD